MKPVTQNLRVIRVPASVHLQAKILAVAEGIPLSELAGEALAAELRRRRERDKIAVASATPQPVQTRG